MNDFEDSYQHDPSDLKSLLKLRAVELFRQCDKEDKGFINKRDIQRMKEPLGLSAELLEEVFESLDYDGNGYLTLEEFTAGFSTYLGTSSSFEENEDVKHYINELDDIRVEEEQLFKETMEGLGASNLIEGESNIKDLWMKLRNEDPSMRKSFENFIGSMCSEITRSKADFSSLEHAWQSKSNNYDEQVRRLYEEMESQLKMEKARAIAQETQKEREIREKLEREMAQKEKFLQDSISKQHELEQKLFNLNMMEFKQKQENERLQKEKAMLEEKLNESVNHLKNSKTYIDNLQKQTKEEKIIRAKQTLKVTENIVNEREVLIKELEQLKEVNKRLQDERDEAALQNTHFATIPHSSDINLNSENSRYPRNRLGSVMANYIRPKHLSIETDDPMHEESSNGATSSSVQDNNNFDDAFYPFNLSKSNFDLENDEKRMSTVTSNNEPLHIFYTNPFNTFSDSILNVPPNATPTRVFKIVFIGDSGVGKTSFVQRFCHNTFIESFSTTIGVDFQVKTINIDGRIIALQLWDTAGQERYRSITKQYFRKADGVICMYDVTSEQSFKNLRNWITSMKESADENCMLTIIGNKIDLCETEDSRVIKYKNGSTLADEHSALFFETSSREGKYVIETIEAIARILQEKEDKQIEDVLNLKTKEKKGRCCS